MQTFIRYTALLLLQKFIFSHGDIFTSMVNLHKLHETERVVIDIVENYLKAREENIDLLKSYLNDYKRHHRTASEDVEKYISNPINAFTLVKRLTADLSQMESLMALDISKDYLTNLTAFKNTTTFPTDEDLSGAAEAIIRLQRTYRLNTRDLAHGKLPGVENYNPLSASDCFELGLHAYDQKHYRYSRSWLHAALETVKTQHGKSTVDKADVLQYQMFAEYKLGNQIAVFQLMTEWMDHNPELNIVAPKNRNDADYRNALNETMEEVQDSISFEGYSALCRGKIRKRLEMTSHLHCRFEDHDNLFLRLAPFKVEEVHRDPDIVIVYDVISDQESETIKRLARPLLERSMVVDDTSKVSDSRISEHAWLTPHVHNHVAKLMRRLQDFTRLDVNNSEGLQVANYGIGGYYVPHYDFFSELGNSDMPVINDRIATVLLYMNDVEQGGATVFPLLGIAVWPKKGAALFWYNLHPSGVGDSDTWHGACPVLLGSKWVGNLWIHTLEQEFRRPCIPDRSSEDRAEMT